ncbi:MAG: beta-glucosidase [Anaerocolumna sp.]|jgi:6-phospho-beta-glucosidase|nr:beta-glucosidase [Anaerocolumna sp.]
MVSMGMHKALLPYAISSISQTGMEILRHPFTTAGIIPDRCGEAGVQACCYQALHHQFVASALAVQKCHELIPNSQMGCMLTKLTTYPRTCAPEDVAATQQKNLDNLFYSDVMVFGEYPKMVLKKFERNNINIEMLPQDMDILKSGCVDFVSFSYYMSMTESVDPNAERTPGNTILSNRNQWSGYGVITGLAEWTKDTHWL